MTTLISGQTAQSFRDATALARTVTESGDLDGFMSIAGELDRDDLLRLLLASSQLHAEALGDLAEQTGTRAIDWERLLGKIDEWAEIVDGTPLTPDETRQAEFEAAADAGWWDTVETMTAAGLIPPGEGDVP